ncbi:MAG: tripartite tricarboxylate transporter substrate binding protein [Burkholderiales bacterium]|nr:tripartite tricarboxylate transporter substrate binding protein [Burkholderiales bacterium]
MRRWLIAFSFCLIAAGAFAQAFPSRPVRVVVPYPAGGVVDIIARSVGERAAATLGQPVVVENRTGAASNIGTEAVAQSAPDGHTLVLASPAHTVNMSLYPKLTWHPLKSFEPVIMVGVIPNVLVVHPSVPAKSVAELIALAKARPGQLNYASAGAGSSVHLATEMLKQAAGVFILHIPYRGQPEATTAMVAGEVQMMALTMALAKPRIESGQLRGLAVTTGKRSTAMPELPTIAESGYPGFDVSTWFAFLAPAGTPAPVVQRLNTDLGAAIRHAEVEKRLRAAGAELNPGTPQELKRFLESDVERWAKVIRQAGIKLE